MIIGLLSVITLCLLVFLASFLVVLIKIRRKYNDIVDFITPPGDKLPSKLAQVSEALSEMIGRAIVASLRGFLLGQKSIEARQANAEAGEAVESSPLGGLVNILPISLKKSLIKNPQMLDLAMGFLSRSGGSGGSSGMGASAGAGGNHQTNPKINFQKYK